MFVKDEKSPFSYGISFKKEKESCCQSKETKDREGEQNQGSEGTKNEEGTQDKGYQKYVFATFGTLVFFIFAVFC